MMVDLFRDPLASLVNLELSDQNGVAYSSPSDRRAPESREETTETEGPGPCLGAWLCKVWRDWRSALVIMEDPAWSTRTPELYERGSPSDSRNDTVKTMVPIDFFTTPTIRFQILHVFLVLARDGIFGDDCTDKSRISASRKCRWNQIGPAAGDRASRANHPNRWPAPLPRATGSVTPAGTLSCSGTGVSRGLFLTAQTAPAGGCGFKFLAGALSRDFGIC
jgi:hypothetical protein